MTDTELSCKELVELITDYLEGRLTPVESATFQAHLHDCPGCATYLDQMRASLRALRSGPALPVPDDMKNRLMAAFRQRNQP
jgi:anti-sigma factor RsiW